MDYPMVIYTEPSLEQWILDRRQKRPTRIVVLTLDYFRELDYYPDIQTIRTDPKWVKIAGWIKDSPQAAMELYNPFNSRKLPWLAEQSKENPFKTKYFFWIDGGIANTMSMDYLDRIRFSKPYLDRFLFLVYPYIPSQEVHGFEKKAMAKWCQVPLTTRVCRAGFFGGNCQDIDQIQDAFQTILRSTLKEGLMGTCDESIYTIISYLNPELYRLTEIESNGLIYRFFDGLK
jgi:hypothetical protein